MNLADPRTVLSEVVAVLTALKLPESYATGEPPVAPAAFDKVKLFDLDDLVKAMEELFAYSNRIALIGLDSLDHRSRVQGKSMYVSRQVSLTVIATDRRFSDRQKALMGDATTPGALLLAKLVVDALAGELASGAVVQPGRGDLISIVDERRKNETGRIVWTQDFTLSTDWEAVGLSRKAKIAPTE